MSVFLLSSCCLSVACDFSVVNVYCSYDRKIKLKIAKRVAVASGTLEAGRPGQPCLGAGGESEGGGVDGKDIWEKGGRAAELNTRHPIKI